MRSLILHPIVLPLLISVFIIYFLLIIRYVQNKQVIKVLEEITIVLLLIILLRPIVPPFTYLQFDALAGNDKSFVSLILQISFYALFVILQPKLFISFLNSFALLFVINNGLVIVI